MKERELIKKAVHEDMPPAESIRGGLLRQRTAKTRRAWAGIALTAAAALLLVWGLPTLLSNSSSELIVPSYAQGQGLINPAVDEDGNSTDPAGSSGGIMPGEGNPELEALYARLEPMASRLMARVEAEGYPDFIGGIFFSEVPELVVSLTEDTAANRAWVTDTAQSTDIRFTGAEYSYNELDAVAAAIAAGMSDGSLPFVLSCGVDVFNARVEVASNSIAEEDLLKLSALDTAGRGAAIFVFYTEDLAEPLADVIR